MNIQGKQIKITHFINPSRFYYRDVPLNAEEYKEEYEQIYGIEKQLASMARKQNPEVFKHFDPSQGDTVAYFCFNNKKFIRCEVDRFEEFSCQKIMILWAIDYGFSFQTKCFNYMFKIPPMKKFAKTKVVSAGLSVLPGTFRFDHVNCRKVLVYSEEWNTRAVVKFQELLENKNIKFYFVPSVIKDVCHSEQQIGDLLVYDKEMMKYGMCSELLRDELAVTVPPKEFQKYYNRLMAIRTERWDDNKRTGGILRKEEGIESHVLNLDPPITVDNVDNYSVTSTEKKYAYAKVQPWLEKQPFDDASNESMSVKSSSSTIENQDEMEDSARSSVRSLWPHSQMFLAAGASLGNRIKSTKKSVLSNASQF